MTVKRALLIGIKYDQAEELLGSYKDVDRVHWFLTTKGFCDDDIFVMKDEDSFPEVQQPTRDNILEAIDRLVADPLSPTDTLFFYFSGHGSQISDENQDERDFFDEVLLTAPSSIRGSPGASTSSPATALGQATHLLSSHGGTIAVAQMLSNMVTFTDTLLKFPGQDLIIDDELYQRLKVKTLPSGCNLIALIDACHSGTVLDLPYQYSVTTGRPKHQGPAVAADYHLDQAYRAVEEIERRLSQPDVDEWTLARPLRRGIRKGRAVLDRFNKVAHSPFAQAMFERADALHSTLKHLERPRSGMRNRLETVRRAELARVTEANVVLISGCNDMKSSEEAPLPNGEQGGVLTWAFLETLVKAEEAGGIGLTVFELMKKVRKKCDEMDSAQKPQLSTGHHIYIKNHPFIL